MKTLNFKSFAKDEIKETELNQLVGGFAGDPVTDLIKPPRKQRIFRENIEQTLRRSLTAKDIDP